MRHRFRSALAALLVLLFAACATSERPRLAEHARAEIRELLPTSLPDRAGWAADFESAFTALGIAPTPENLCAALAIAEQESGFAVDPVVPGLARIARAEIDRRARQHHVPLFLVDAALKLKSPDGRRYDERLAAVKTEHDLSLVYTDFIGAVPLGGRLFADANPVRTGGPMQVSIAYAERHARERRYPYPHDTTIRHEVFTRRGGVYFGVAHLLDYDTSYDRPIYRCADFNAGRYASRNAAFQQAVARASGIELAADGDHVRYDGRGSGATEIAVRTLAPALELSESQIHRMLERGDSADFDATPLYTRVFALAEHRAGRALPRAVLPRIALVSPKITRKLTTEWFAKRVDERYARCLAR